MKVLLTGAFGTIGAAALKELIQQGHTVRTFDIKQGENEQKAKQLSKKYPIEQVWGDIRNIDDVNKAVQHQEVIVHLAHLIPPSAAEHLAEAQAVNIDGTRHIITAAKKLFTPPSILFGSTSHVFGYTQQQSAPRKVDDPIAGTDVYTKHKVVGEKEISESGLTWAIYRFAEVPALETWKPQAAIFDIPLDTRFELLHPEDAGRAIASGLQSPIWGKVWLIGGGEKCQLHYQDYINKLLVASGIGELPAEAFSSDAYYTDWLDSSESEATLHYQKHSFDEIVDELAKFAAPSGLHASFITHLERQQVLKQSPYYKKS